MTLKNTTLINLIKTVGEERAAELLASKIAHDEKQRAYHSKYNKTRAMLMRELKASGLSIEELLTKAQSA